MAWRAEFARDRSLHHADTQVWVTCSDDLFDLNEGGVDLFGELPHGLIWVLVGKRVDVNLHRYKNSTIIIVSRPRSFKTVFDWLIGRVVALSLIGCQTHSAPSGSGRSCRGCARSSSSW